MSLPELCTPDGIEPIVGWRYWRAEAGWLFSLNRFKTWPAARALEARCSLTDGHAQPPPGERCGCGIYAALDLDTLKEITEPDLESPLVVGEVALWGRVIPADLGYRAQFGYPRCLWVVRESLPALDWTADMPLCLSEMYGIPVETCDARWAVVAEGVNPWPREPRVAEIRAAVSSFKQSVERLAAALADGQEAYARELARLRAEDRTEPLARSAFRSSFARD